MQYITTTLEEHIMFAFVIAAIDFSVRKLRDKIYDLEAL